MKIGLVGNEFCGSSMPLHQTFLSSGQVNSTWFTVDPDQSCDFIVTFGAFPKSLPDWWKDYPKSKKVAILPENPYIHFPDLGYISNHGILISPVVPRNIESIHWLPYHGGVPWFYGMNYRTDRGLIHVPADTLPKELQYHASRLVPKKERLISFITSVKTGLPGYKYRLSLASALKKRLGDDIDIYGFGHNPIASKQAAIDPYSYTIAIENSFLTNYWTEKLSDSYLGFTAPIYLGAPNIQDYFEYPIQQLPMDSIDKAIDIVTKVIESPPDFLSIFNNRQKILYRHNLFYLLEHLLENL